MTTIAFPLTQATLADKLKINSVQWVPYETEEVSGIASSETLSAKLAPMVYEASVRTIDMTIAEANQISAILEVLGGSQNAFYLHNPLAQYPQADPTGSIIGASTPTIHTVDADNKHIRVQGLTGGAYTITIGDMLAVDYAGATRRMLLRAAETVVAVVGLTPLFEVRPFIRPGLVAGNAVNVKRPAAKVKLVPKSLTIGSGRYPTTVVMSFRVRQTYQAG